MSNATEQGPTCELCGAEVDTSSGEYIYEDLCPGCYALAEGAYRGLEAVAADWFEREEEFWRCRYCNEGAANVDEVVHLAGCPVTRAKRLGITIKPNASK